MNTVKENAVSAFFNFCNHDRSDITLKGVIIQEGLTDSKRIPPSLYIL